MASYDVNAEAKTLTDAGWSDSKIEALHDRIVNRYGDWSAQNRTAQNVISAAAAAASAQTVASRPTTPRATTSTRCAQCDHHGARTERCDSSGIYGMVCDRCARCDQYELSFC